MLFSELLFEWKEYINFYFLTTLAIRGGKDLLTISKSTSDKETTCQWRRHKRLRFDPWVRKIPWMRAWQPTSVFLPGGSHRQRSLAGYSKHSHEQLDATEATYTHSTVELIKIHTHAQGFSCSSVGKESACSEGHPGSIPGLGGSPGEGNGDPLQYPCLEKSHGQRIQVGCSPWGRKE